MEKRINLETSDRLPADIHELVLDNCRTTNIEGLTEEFCNLEFLSLIKVGLTSLKGFPKLLNLQKLDLSCNHIEGGLNVLQGCPKLAWLNLSGNKIGTVDSLDPLKELKYLKSLDLSACPVTSLEDYRKKVFALLPSLDFLNGYDAHNREENGTHEESDLDDEEDEEDEEEEEEEEEEGEVGLAYLENDMDEESEGDDYDPEGADDGDEEIEDDGDDEEATEAPQRGTKRKCEND